MPPRGPLRLRQGSCSTPFGIEARRTVAPSTVTPAQALGAQRLSASRQGGPTSLHRRGSSSDVLNAFRHRGKEDVHKTQEPRRICGSAQRLSASRQGGPIMPMAAAADSCTCSTPFGIEARRTLEWPGLADFLVKCSTPFGIEARRTPSPVAPRAQRLSASRQGGHLARANVGRLAYVCSTPFGIEARRTGQGSGRARTPDPRVLNAFRHRGKEDRLPPVPNATAGHCAQRLSASRQGGRADDPDLHPLDSGCAQPLSASRQGGRVPNTQVKAVPDMCSTPFGIEARRTRNRPVRWACDAARVLNAFRHRGKEDAYGHAPD